MVEVQPDALLILGDTNSCLSAIAAKRLHVPIFHMEAGNRCKDECLPEETNRRIVDVISDVNLAYSEHARRYLKDTGCAPERTYVTGSPMAEVLRANLGKIERRTSSPSSALSRRSTCCCPPTARRTSTPRPTSRACSPRSTRWPRDTTCRSCTPATRAPASAWRPPASSSTRACACTSMGFHDYNCLQMNAFAVVSDSGTLPEESSFFASVGRPFPAVCIRTSTERPEALDKACFTLAGISERGLLQAVHTAVELDAEGSLPEAPVPDYATRPCPPRSSRSSRATPASWTRWCGGRTCRLNRSRYLKRGIYD